uniref:Uncharacterized protein n=1 Tax=Escherichia coli TaxID=562 RepID=A0A7G9AA20_ECOLX|nr:hypothetical protein [Escherichia coli]
MSKWFFLWFAVFSYVAKLVLFYSPGDTTLSDSDSPVFLFK